MSWSPTASFSFSITSFMGTPGERRQLACGFGGSFMLASEPCASSNKLDKSTRGDVRQSGLDHSVQVSGTPEQQQQRAPPSSPSCWVKGSQKPLSTSFHALSPPAGRTEEAEGWLAHMPT